MRGTTRLLWRGAALLVLLAPAVPVAAWLGVADHGPAGWQTTLVRWAIGLALLAALAAFLSRPAVAARLPSLPRPSGTDRWWVAVTALWTTLAAVVVMRVLLKENPHLIDEMVQLLQARTYAAGRLAAPLPEPAEAFLIPATGPAPSGWVTQFPPGQGFLLAAGLLLNAQWLVVPLLAGLGAVAFWHLARGLYGRRTARLALLLWASCPWLLFSAGTYMSHVPALAAALGAFSLVFGPRSSGKWHALGAGILLGATFAIRPLEALLAALPIAVWWLGRRGGRVRLAALALGALPLAALVAWVNLRAFGSPLTFGYGYLWGSSHSFGFHTTPYGEPFTPAQAIANLSGSLRLLHIYLFEWPIAALLPLVVWGWAAGPGRRADLVVATGFLAVLLAFLFYWHVGFWLGPRFYLGLLPWALLATARSLSWLARRTEAWGGTRWRAAVVWAGVAGLLWSWGVNVPHRARRHADDLPEFVAHPDRVLREAGVERALVLVRDSWSNRIYAGFQGLAASAPLIETANRRADACDLQAALDSARAIEDAGAGGRGREAAERSLRRLIAGPLAPLDGRTGVRLRSARGLPPRCRAEWEADRSGVLLYVPYAWRNALGARRGIVFARDLPLDRSRLLARYAGWPLWLLARETTGGGDRFVLRPLGSGLSRAGGAQPRAPPPAPARTPPARAGG